MKAKIREILSKHGRLPVAVNTLGDHDDLHAAGLTSFASVEIMMALEEAFDVEYPDNMMSRRNFSSIAAIESALERVRQVAVR
jgi:acyl carrier protein